MEYLLDWLDDFIFNIIIWMGYIHIYGISLSPYKEENRNGEIWNKIKNLKISVIFWGICIIVYIIADGFLEEPAKSTCILIYIVFLHAFFYCVAVEKKIRTSLWLWVVLFTISLPRAIVDAICLVAGVDILIDSIEYELSMDLFVLFLLIVLYFLDIKFHFAKRVQRKEKFLLFTISAFISFVGIGGFSEDMQLKIGESEVLALLVYLTLSAVALVMVIRIIVVGTAADYYEELSTMYEKNAKETLAFYESYKEAQIETRKLRHDMRNHFFCIQMLAREGKYAELEKYIEGFSEAVSDISMRFQTGNDIVDAILNVKYNMAKKKGIEIELEGNVPIMPFIDAMDWCKIFSNGVDNGIEALEKCEESRRVLKIQLKSNGHFFVIHIENPCVKKVLISGSGVSTSKEETHKHGFGLKNMESALKKYGGELNLACKKEGEGYVFVVDMIMPERQSL